MADEGSKRTKKMNLVHRCSAVIRMVLICIAFIVVCAVLVDACGQINAGYFACDMLYYLVLAQILACGIPLSINRVIKKIKTGDQRSLLLVRKRMIEILMAAGAAGAVIMFVFSDGLAGWILTGAGRTDIGQLTMGFRILAAAMLFTPVYYGYLGFYHARKKDQLCRRALGIQIGITAGGILFAAWFMGSLLHLDGSIVLNGCWIVVCAGIWMGLGYLKLYDMKDHERMLAYARRQTFAAVPEKEILHVLGKDCAVSAFTALFLYACPLINVTCIISSGMRLGMTYDTSLAVFALMCADCSVFLLIPHMIGLAYDWKYRAHLDVRQGNDCDEFNRFLELLLSRIGYAVIPVCLSICFLSSWIFTSLFGSASIEYGTLFLTWMGIEGIFSVLALTGVLILLKMDLKKETLIYLIAGTIIKICGLYFLMSYFGIANLIISSILSDMTIIFLTYSKISNRTEMIYGRLAARYACMVTAGLAVNGAYALLKTYVLKIGEIWWQDLGAFAVLLLAGIIVYHFIMHIFNIPKRMDRQEADIMRRGQDI